MIPYNKVYVSSIYCVLPTSIEKHIIIHSGIFIAAEPFYNVIEVCRQLNNNLHSATHVIPFMIFFRNSNSVKLCEFMIYFFSLIEPGECSGNTNTACAADSDGRITQDKCNAIGCCWDTTPGASPPCYNTPGEYLIYPLTL